MFTPVSTSLGALLLSASTTFLLYTSGRILGVSSIVRSLPSAPSLIHNVPLLAGMGASVPLVKLLLPNYIPAYPSIESSGIGYGLAGVGLLGALTGWGTKAGCGCTSGHMLCGLARFSVRSLIAVGIFFPVAVITAGLSGVLNSVGCGDLPCYTPVWPTRTEAIIMGSVVVLAFSVNNLLRKSLERMEEEKAENDDDNGKSALEPVEERKFSKAAVAFVAGLEFGMGLLISGMADPMKPLRFFALPFDITKWDPSLALVMLFGLGPNILVTQMTGLSGKPLLDRKLWLPDGKVSDIGWRYVLGAAAFGIAWGLSGVCPGPGVVRTVAQPAWGVAWLAGYWIGGLF
ncbi:unnamed protein product [Calypogeia fissa]